jgi:chemotaxis protein methyltransferase CheR
MASPAALGSRKGPPRGDTEAVGEFAFTAADFQTIARKVQDRTGIVLGATKRNLVYGRLGRRLRILGCDSFEAYLALLDGPDAETEHAAMINAITTNLTGFFREPHHFQTLGNEMLPELVRSPHHGRRLRIWSAGCSSGEEPYSIAMTVLKALPSQPEWDALILATDIDTNMIAAGRAGIYDAARAEPIPPDLARRFVRRIDDDKIEMAPALKRIIRFKPLNLLEHWPMRGKFDAIFCRNVVIYFDKETQRTLFDRYADMLKPGGWLFIGHSESLFRVSERFRHLGRTTYRKVR